MKYIKQKLAIVLPMLLLFIFSGQALVPAGAFACGSSTGSSTAQVQYAVGSQTGNKDCSGSGVAKAIAAAVDVLSIIIGGAAVIMILVSGLRYITSNGDSAKVSNAKTTLIYALIGVAIAGLAQFLVHFALYNASNAL
jgi:hypothetical protein